MQEAFALVLYPYLGFDEIYICNKNLEICLKRIS